MFMHQIAVDQLSSVDVSGAIHILVSPPTREGGLDVLECQVVIRFDKFATAKSRSQSVDRARRAEAKVNETVRNCDVSIISTSDCDVSII